MNDERALNQKATRSGRRDAVENRERILSAARRLFAARGIETTSMNQIAQAAGVGPGTLYRNYAHKGLLCLAVAEDDVRSFQRRVTEIVAAPSPVSALERLELVLDEWFRLFDSHIPLLVAMQDAFAEGHRTDGYYLGSPYRWMHEQLVRLLNSAAERREILPLDVEFTADAIFAAVAPPLVLFQQRHRGFDRARIAAGVRHLFIDGLRAAAPGRAAD